MASSQSNHLDGEWLFQKYVVEGLSTYDIGKIVGRDPKNVYNKLKDFGIPTRTRGETLQKNAWWKQGLPSKRIGKKHSDKTKIKISETRIKKGIKGMSGKDNPMFGKRSPNWKGGVTPERQKLYGQELWKSIVKEVFERDNWLCKKCGGKHEYRNPLHTHHIKSWADYPDNRFDLGNLITLCKRCHNWIHSKKNIERELLD